MGWEIWEILSWELLGDLESCDWENEYLCKNKNCSNSRSEGGAEPHPNGCILLARVPAARAGGVRRGLGADPVPAGEFCQGMGWPVPKHEKRRKVRKSAILMKFSEFH